MQKEKTDLLNSFIGSIKFANPQSYKTMIVFPLYSDIVSDNGYMLLDEALKTDKFRIQEISESGSVPELAVINELDSDVLILEGEILLGAKQNRTINTTIIVGKGKKIIIPVSCVEKGRWNYSNRGFKSSPYYADPDIRRMKARSVSMSLKSGRSYRSDQRSIWKNIYQKMDRHDFMSSTGSVSDLYELREEQFNSYERGFSCRDLQIGVAVFIDSMLSGCDIFGVKGILSKIFHKVIKGYIFEGIDSVYKQKTMEQKIDYMLLEEQLDSFFRAITTMPKDVFKSFGEGDDIRFDRGDITGFALTHDERVIHLAGFHWMK